MEADAMTSGTKPKRGGETARREPRRPCPHPGGTKKVKGKICCAECGVQLYL